MARKFLTPIDLTQLELQNAVIQNLASAPSSPAIGQIYFDTTLGYLRSWNGTSWLNASIGNDGAQGTQGIQGIQGANGNDGAQGADGMQGAQGYNGNDGAQGADGMQGIQGFQGFDGAQGAQGYNAGILGVNSDFTIDGSSNLTLNYSNVETQLSNDGFVKNNDSSINVGGSGDFTVTASNNIVLNPASGDAAYIGSVGANNKIATIQDVLGAEYVQAVNGPLSVTGSTLNLNYGAGLGLSGSDLVVNTDNTLTTSAGGSENQLGVNAGVGLTKDNNGYIAVNVGSGLDVNGTTGAVEVDTSTIATKSYVDSVAQGLNVKLSVRVASSANVSNLLGVFTLDGVTLADEDRVLLKDQSTSSENGIYVASAVLGGVSLSRATDEGTPAKGDFVFVEEGTHAATGWILSDATAGTWTQFSAAGEYTAGTNISISGNTISVQDAPTFNNPTVTVGSTVTVDRSNWWSDYTGNYFYTSGSGTVEFGTGPKTLNNISTLSSIPNGTVLTFTGNDGHVVTFTKNGTPTTNFADTISLPATNISGGNYESPSQSYTLTYVNSVTVSSTEISYLDGVTSNIQTQLDAKAPKAAPTFTGDVTFQSAGGAGSTNNHISVDNSTGDMTVESNAYKLNLIAQSDVNVTSNGGDIVLNADGNAYVGSAASGNEIATRSYVDGKKYSATITGDSSTSSFPLTHGLSTADVEISVYDASGAKVETDITVNSTTASVGFAVAPSTGTTYRVVVQG